MSTTLTVIGQAAPDFELPGSEGKSVKLSDYRGSRVLLYFYPKDLTSSCSTQACDFRDKHAEFEGLNTVILGISPIHLSSMTSLLPSTVYLFSCYLMKSIRWLKPMVYGSKNKCTASSTWALFALRSLLMRMAF